MVSYEKLVEMGIGRIVNWKWHKIICIEAGEAREKFLIDICKGSPIIANFGENQCSGIYIKDKGLPDRENPNDAPYAFERVAKEYYNLLIMKGILSKIAKEVTGVKMVKKLLAEMKQQLSFEGDSLKELLVAIDISLEMIKITYLELRKTGMVDKSYRDNLPLESCCFVMLDEVIESLHECLGNSYSNFAIIFDTDKELSILSKKALNDYIFARTIGYKINVVCEQKLLEFENLLDEKEKRRIIVPDWYAYNLRGDIIENPHDYSSLDYTDNLKELTLKKAK